MAGLTIGGVPCTIYWGEDGQSHGIRESWPSEGPRATVHYLCAWSKRYQLMAALRGGVAGFVRVIPHQYPTSPNLICLSIGEVEGLKGRRDSNNWATYESAIIPAEYGIPAWDTVASAPDEPQSDPSGKAFTKTKMRASAEVFQPPLGAYYWKDGPDVGKKLNDSQIGIIRPRVEIQMTRLFAPFVPLDFARAYLGMLNDKPVYIADTIFQRGTLMLAAFDAGDGSDDGSGAGSLEGKTFELQYTFVGNGYVDDGSGTSTLIAPDWNQYLGSDGKWHFITTKSDGTGSTPYFYADYYEVIP